MYLKLSSHDELQFSIIPTLLLITLNHHRLWRRCLNIMYDNIQSLFSLLRRHLLVTKKRSETHLVVDCGPFYTTVILMHFQFIMNVI